MTKQSRLKKDIEQAINKHSIEDGSDTPDSILAEYLISCLRAFDHAVNKREKWYGRREFDCITVFKKDGNNRIN